MSDIYARRQCAAGSHCDMVGLQFGPHRVSMYYQTAFKVAAGVLQAAKLAARYEGVHPKKWSEMANQAPYNDIRPTHREYRRSTYTPNFTHWELGFDGSIVVFTFDRTIIRMHYADAFHLYGWIRQEARNAKAWAGDRSRIWTTQATLADAEDNDKFVYTQ